MSRAIKLKNNDYLDSESIIHKRKKLSDILYPIGSIYMSVNNTSPANLFGGTWEQITNRFLYCTTTSKKLGGSNTHTLTIDEMPIHSHNIRKYNWLASTSTGGNLLVHYNNSEIDKGETAGGGKEHNNMPAYFTVFCWYRIS